MSTVSTKLDRLKVRYSEDALMEPRHVFELCEALDAELDLLAARLTKLERFVKPVPSQRG